MLQQSLSEFFRKQNRGNGDDQGGGGGGGGTVAWADFVFHSDYARRSFASVHEYVMKNKHLPFMRSEKEVVETGIGEKRSTKNACVSCHVTLLVVCDIATALCLEMISDLLRAPARRRY
jgi:hypothetical protein